MNHLTKLSIRDAEIVADINGQDVFHVRDPHALIQASGYLKYIRSRHKEAILFRGQSRLYGTLSPTLFRGISAKQAAQSARVERQNSFIAKIVQSCAIFKQFGKFSHEPLLQHYGLSTTWIDLVDNIWVALWFACHKAHFSGRNSEYLHFERRRPNDGAGDFAYVLLIAADATQTAAAGLWKGPKTELVDLRVACPSIFLRPHAQHAALFRLRGRGTTRPVDYSEQIRGIVRIGLEDALRWLGDSATLGIHSLFPPPYYDHGYKLLLDQKFPNNNNVGTIHLVGA